MAIVIESLRNGYQATANVVNGTLQKTKQTYAASIALLEKYGPLALQVAKVIACWYASQLLFASFGSFSSGCGNDTVKKIGSSSITKNLFDLAKGLLIPSYFQDGYAALSQLIKPAPQSESQASREPVVIIQQPSPPSADPELNRRISALEDQLENLSSQEPPSNPISQSHSRLDSQASSPSSPRLLPQALMPSPNRENTPTPSVIDPDNQTSNSTLHSPPSSISSNQGNTRHLSPLVEPTQTAPITTPSLIKPVSSAYAHEYLTQIDVTPLETQIEYLTRQLAENQQKLQAETSAAEFQNQDLQKEIETLQGQLEHTEAWSESEQERLQSELKERQVKIEKQQKQIDELQAQFSKLQQFLASLKKIRHWSSL